MTCHTKDLYHYNTRATLDQGTQRHCSGELGVRGVFLVPELAWLICCVSTHDDYTSGKTLRGYQICFVLPALSSPMMLIVCPELWEHLLGVSWPAVAVRGNIMSGVCVTWLACSRFNASNGHTMASVQTQECQPTPPRYQQIFPLDSGAPWCLMWLLMQIKVASPQ